MPGLKLNHVSKRGHMWPIFPYPPGWVTKPISSVPLFSEFFNTVKTHVSYWISRLYLTCVAAVQLRWHLSNMNVIWKNLTGTFAKSNFAYREINERSFSNRPPSPPTTPTPTHGSYMDWCSVSYTNVQYFCSQLNKLPSSFDFTLIENKPHN